MERAIAWLLSTFAVVLPLIFGQPSDRPETRQSPYVDEMPPDKYGVWPTEEFETADAPWWLATGLLRPAYNLRGLLALGSKNEAIVVLHKGKIVYEWYGDGWDKDKPHALNSVTKSVTQALVGIAIEEGYINSVNDKVIDYFPDANIEVDAGLKKEITIEQMLTMTSGLAGDFDDIYGQIYAGATTDAQIEAIDRRIEQDTARTWLERISLIAKPGERWNYSTLSTTILLSLVGRAIDQPLKEYVEEKLFDPMGITEYDWYKNYDETLFGGSGLYLTPRDAAKFGYLYLNYGRWEDQQLVPADWVAQSGPQSKLPFAYGRLFWNTPLTPLLGAYEAFGASGQFIDIFPKQDLVIVRTGDASVRFMVEF